MLQNIRLGVFILLSLTALAAGIFLIGNQRALWQKTYVVKAQFDNVVGLTTGSEVRLGGTREGHVQEIQLPREPTGKVTVVMTLSEATRDVVRLDSVATIRSEGLLGDKFVEISFGGANAGKLKGGDVLRSVPPVDMSDILAKANGILDSTQTAVDSMQAAAGNISEITEKVNAGKGTAGALLNDRSMYNKATASVSALHDDLEALKGNFLLRGFFNKRGYVDSEELKKHELTTMPTGQPTKTFDFEAKELFGQADSAKLKNKKDVDEVGAYLQSGKFSLALVMASAGPMGDSSKMLVLTEAQSTVIRNYLVQHFRIDDTRVKTRGLGKSASESSIEIRVYPAS